MHTRVKKLNPHANTPAVVKMNGINPRYIMFGRGICEKYQS
jgi:hypothetical protein